MGRRKVGNGEGSLYYSESLGKLIYQYYDNDGKRQTMTQKKNEKVGDFKSRVTDIKHKLDTGELCVKNKITIPELGKEIIETEFKRNLISAVTYNRKTQTLTHIENGLKDVKIQNADYVKIQKFIDTKIEYSNSYITKMYLLLCQIFKEAIKRDYIIKDPMIKVEKPKSDKKSKKVEAFTIEEQKMFINAIQDNPYKNIFIIAIYSGMRMGEILALSLNDIDLKNNEIHIQRTLTKDTDGKTILGTTTKTYNSNRIIPITPLFKNELVESISNMTLNKDKTIFTRNGKLISVSSINSQFTTICKNLGFGLYTTTITRNDREKERTINHTTSNYNQHMLRHTYATRMIEAGVRAEVLQKLLGHTDIQTTINTYTSIFNKYKNEQINTYLDYMKSI